MAGKDVADPLQKIPQYCQAIFSARPDAVVNSARALRSISSSPELRKQLAMAEGVIDALSFVIGIEVNTDIMHRSRQHALTCLINLLLEEPAIDTHICNQEGLVSSLAKALRAPFADIVELAATALDYLAVLEENRPLICLGNDHVLVNAVDVIISSPESAIATRKHVYQLLVYLSGESKNLFLLCRTANLMAVLASGLCDEDKDIYERSLHMLYNLSSIPENHRIISTSRDVMEALEIISKAPEDGGADNQRAIAADILQTVLPRGSNQTFGGEQQQQQHEQQQQQQQQQQVRFAE